MTTEYYQIPSQQGLLPLASGDSADPWLAAATNSLSISDSWSANKGKQLSSPPSLFEPGDAEASVSWKNVVPLQYSVKATSMDVKMPVAPKQFNSTTSKIDAWSVVIDNNAIALNKQPKTKQVKQPSNKPQQAKQVNKQMKSTQLVVEEKPTAEEEVIQNISFVQCIKHPYCRTLNTALPHIKYLIDTLLIKCIPLNYLSQQPHPLFT
jgi:hypothetical protein